MHVASVVPQRLDGVGRLCNNELLEREQPAAKGWEVGFGRVEELLGKCIDGIHERFAFKRCPTQLIQKGVKRLATADAGRSGRRLELLVQPVGTSPELTKYQSVGAQKLDEKVLCNGRPRGIHAGKGLDSVRDPIAQ